MSTTDGFMGENIAVLRPDRRGAPKPPPEKGEDPYQRLIAIGIALAAEHDRERLLEMIVEQAMEITGADAGGLYLRGDDDALVAVIVRNRVQEATRAGQAAPPCPRFPSTCRNRAPPITAMSRAMWRSPDAASISPTPMHPMDPLSPVVGPVTMPAAIVQSRS